MTLSSIKTQLEEYYRLHNHAGIDEVGDAIDSLSDAIAALEDEGDPSNCTREHRLTGQELGIKTGSRT